MTKRNISDFREKLNNVLNYTKLLNKKLSLSNKYRKNDLLLSKIEDMNRLVINYREIVYNNNSYIHIKNNYDIIYEILDDVFNIIKTSKSIEELVIFQHEEYELIKNYIDQWKYKWENDYSDKLVGITLYCHPYSLEGWINGASGGNCPLCGKPTQMKMGEYGIFFGCSEFGSKGCRGIIKPNKRQLEEFCKEEDYWKWVEYEKEREDELMMVYPDWDPEFESIDSYEEKNGII